MKKKLLFGSAAKPKKHPVVVSISATQFESLRTDESFIKICQLTRYLNQLIFFFQVYLDASQNSAVGERQVNNVALYIAGVMFEALKFCPQLSPDFDDYEAYKKKFSVILSDPMTKMLKQSEFDLSTPTFQKQMNHARNKIVFHVDADVYRKTLVSESATGKMFKLPEYQFIKGDDEQNMFTWHFNLTDNLSMNFLIDREDDDEKELKHLEDFNNKLFAFTEGFISAGISLAVEYGLKKGWTRN